LLFTDSLLNLSAFLQIIYKSADQQKAEKQGRDDPTYPSTVKDV